jgi:hypothetical protein
MKNANKSIYAHGGCKSWTLTHTGTFYGGPVKSHQQNVRKMWGTISYWRFFAKGGRMFSSRGSKDCQERNSCLCLENSVVQPLLTDLYQITMAYAYWKSGMEYLFLFSLSRSYNLERVLCAYHSCVHIGQQSIICKWCRQTMNHGIRNLFRLWQPPYGTLLGSTFFMNADPVQ